MVANHWLGLSFFLCRSHAVQYGLDRHLLLWRSRPTRSAENTMDLNRKRDCRSESIWYNRLPTLQYHYPSFKVKWRLRENSLQILFRCKAKLKQRWTQIPFSDSANHIPMMKKKVHQSPSLLKWGVGDSSGKHKFVSLNEVGAVGGRDSDERFTERGTVLLPFPFFSSWVVVRDCVVLRWCKEDKYEGLQGVVSLCSRRRNYKGVVDEDKA